MNPYVWRLGNSTLDNSIPQERTSCKVISLRSTDEKNKNISGRRLLGDAGTDG